jgi:RNA polymerase sigma factor (sigma-70 family)
MYLAVLARAKTVQRSAFRRRGRERRYAENVVSADPEVMPEVARAVARLSPQQRACIFLTYWEDLTPRQVGERLSIAEGTVKLHLARARQNLREVLDD